MIAVGIIPARYDSSRLPGKPLADICGRPMIQHVYERAARAARLSDLLVATDDQRVFDAVRRFNGKAVMTDPSHPSGTDRLAEVASGMDADVVVNVQGDEPLLDPHSVDLLVEPFLGGGPDLRMVTLATPIVDDAEFHRPSVVKVVVDQGGFALYFSREPIPHSREGAGSERLKHIGMYAYRRSFLLEYAALPPTPLERSECLEQLRALEHGHRILVVRTDHDAVSVDTPEDLRNVRELVAAGGPA